MLILLHDQLVESAVRQEKHKDVERPLLRESTFRLLLLPNLNFQQCQNIATGDGSTAGHRGHPHWQSCAN